MSAGILSGCTAVSRCFKFFVLYVIDTGSIGSRPGRVAELGVTYLPFTISSDAGYADLPLALLGAPVSIGAAGRSPGTGPHGPFRLHRGSAAIHPSRSRF